MLLYGVSTLFVTNEDECRAQCMQQTSFICASINYRHDDGECKLLVENNQTAYTVYSRAGVSRQFKYSIRPKCADSSPSITNLKIRDYGSGAHDFMLLFNYKIEADGYLVGWKYLIGHSTDYCDSYAAVWRQTGEGNSSVFNMITETLLTPEDTSTGEIRFQLVQNSTEVVRKGDFLALYTVKNNNSTCLGSLVSFRENMPRDHLAYISSNPNRNRRDRLEASDVGVQTRAVALRAYIAAGQIRITWEFPATAPNQELATTHFKIECSDNSNFNTVISSKLVSIEYRETVISNLNIQQPYYARVSTVRNYNGEELIQDVYTVSSLFCAEKGRVASTDVFITESEVLQPEEEITFTVSIPSLEADDCVSSVTLTYGSGQLSYQKKTGSWTFTKQQGVTFELTIKVELIDGHENIIWQEEYTTGWTIGVAASVPTGLLIILLAAILIVVLVRRLSGTESRGKRSQPDTECSRMELLPTSTVEENAAPTSPDAPDVPNTPGVSYAPGVQDRPKQNLKYEKLNLQAAVDNHDYEKVNQNREHNSVHYENSSTFIDSR
ncbi:hypothetical protein EB796_020393 [Bugula neritina]|uniref:Apple domain-containing protein n=1 Tax=Bugula neritina TaxID=10212 RepID=A0A7J7J528_BUGNE|nr:hypothetical protein EB796_020393 [Bugula neritina]